MMEKFCKKKEEEAKTLDISKYQAKVHKRFQEPKYRDIWATALFFLQIFLLFVLAVGGLVASFFSDGEPVQINLSFLELEFQALSFGDAVSIALSAIVCGIVGSIISIIWVIFMYKFPKQFIEKGVIISFIIILISSIFIFLLGYFTNDPLFFSFLFLLMALLFFLLLLRNSWAKRIEFSACLLADIMKILKNFPGIFFVNFFSIGVYGLWSIFWIICFNLIFQYVYFSAIFVTIASFLAFLSWFWTTQVIKNVVHTATAGVVGTWYFSDNDNMPRGVVKDSLKKALTTSFGSICFGSLLVAISSARSIAESVVSDPSQNCIVIAVCFVIAALLYVVEVVLKYFNRYAYTFVAIYGKSYVSSAKRAIKLLQYYGLEAVINDSLIGNIIGLGCLVASLFSSLAAIAITFLLYKLGYLDSTAISLGFTLGFLTAYGIILVSMETIHSAVIALFVCVCDEPRRLKTKNPEIWDLVHDHYAEPCSNLISNP